jgi:hypothetical protein
MAPRSRRGTENYVRLPSDQKDNQSLQTKENSPSPRKRAFYFLSNTELR